MNQDILYTPEEIAEKLKLSKYTVYEMIKRGDIQAHRIGRSLRISDEQLNNYILRAKGVENLYEAEIVEKDAEQFALVNGLQIGIVTELSGSAKISVHPEDIILSKEKFSSSARNMYVGKVIDVHMIGNEAKVKLDIGVPITAMITKRSLIEMKIETHQQLVVIFKATQVKVFK